MQGADDSPVSQGALVQGGAQVGADIGHAVYTPVVVGDQEELQTLGLDGDDVPRSDVCGLEQGHPLVLCLHTLDADGAVWILLTSSHGGHPGSGLGGERHYGGWEASRAHGQCWKNASPNG